MYMYNRYTALVRPVHINIINSETSLNFNVL